MGGSDRVSVRVGTERLERLQNRCREADCDISRLVRQCLDLFLGSEAASTAGAVPRRLAPPEDIRPRLPKYLGWANGDLRVEHKRLFLELIAASFACKRFYPRTPGIVEGYEALLQLCSFFGVE
jgi:hypothetical protein